MMEEEEEKLSQLASRAWLLFAARAAKVAEFVCVRLVRWCSEPSARAVGSIYVISAGYGMDGWMVDGWLRACERALSIVKKKKKSQTGGGRWATDVPCARRRSRL